MTTATEHHEAIVRRFYDDDGEGARQAYTELMGPVWHHGDRATEEAGKSVQEAAEVMQRRLMNLAGLQPGDRALDFGSGPGGATAAMAAMTGATFIGLSNSESLNQSARQLVAGQGLDDKVFFMTIGDRDYRTLGAWPDHSFDAVCFLESICHLPDKPAFFQAAHRVLRPGGRLVGLDWLQRPFGPYQTEDQIQAITGPVCEHIRLAGLGTVESYAAMMNAAGFEITHAADEFPEQHCWGSTPPQDRERWLMYNGPSGSLFQSGKRALDAARAAGVFTVGLFAGTKSNLR